MKIKSRADDVETHLSILPFVHSEICRFPVEEFTLACVWLNTLNDFLSLDQIDEASLVAMEALSLLVYPIIHRYIAEFSNAMGFDTQKGHACIVRLLAQVRQIRVYFHSSLFFIPFSFFLSISFSLTSPFRELGGNKYATTKLLENFHICAIKSLVKKGNRKKSQMETHVIKENELLNEIKNRHLSVPGMLERRR